MPSKSQAQQGFMGAELARKRAGEPTQTGMSEQQLEDFAHTPRTGLPKHVNPKIANKRRLRKIGAAFSGQAHLPQPKVPSGKLHIPKPIPKMPKPPVPGIGQTIRGY